MEIPSLICMSTVARIAWEQFTLDPRREDAAAVRASDKDRDVALSALGEAFADGRLDHAELDERTTRVQGSKRLGELVAPLNDLAPSEPVASRPPAPRPQAPERSIGGVRLMFLVPALVCWAVWLATSLGPHGFEPSFPWPLFVTLGSARMAFGRHPHRLGRC